MCGIVDANGNFTAPQVLPNSPTVSLTAHSVADPSKQANGDAHHHQQLHAATDSANERARIVIGADHRGAASGDRIESLASADVVTLGKRMQRLRVRRADGVDAAIDRRRDLGELRDVQRAFQRPESRDGNDHRNATSGPIEESAGHAE